MYAIVGSCLMHLQKKKKKKKKAFTNGEDPDETFTNGEDPDETVSSGYALFAMLSTFLVTEDNIISYMNHGHFQFINGC